MRSLNALSLFTIYETKAESFVVIHRPMARAQLKYRFVIRSWKIIITFNNLDYSYLRKAMTRSGKYLSCSPCVSANPEASGGDVNVGHMEHGAGNLHN